MNSRAGLAQASGYLRLGQITSVNPEKFRCDVEFPGSSSIARDVVLTPSAHLGIMPEVGCRVAVYSRPGAGNRIISFLDQPDGRVGSEVLEQETKPGYIPSMEPGDMFVGHRGKAYFTKGGDVRVSSRGSRAYLELKTEKARAELYGYNFEFSTPGKNVRINSRSTVSAGPLQTWGDSLNLEVNVPLASAAPDFSEEVLPSTLGAIRIANTGAVSIDVLPLSTAANLQMDITGNIELGRGIGAKTTALVMDALDNVSLYNVMGELSISSDGTAELSSVPGDNRLTLDSTKGITLTNNLGTLDISLGGDISVYNSKTRMDMLASGAFSLAPASGTDYALTITPVGGVLLRGKTADILATSTATITAATSLIMAAPQISLGAAAVSHVALSELVALLFQQVNTLMAAIKTHTHPVATTGSASAQSGTASPSSSLQAAIVPIVATPVTIGSMTVKAQV